MNDTQSKYDFIVIGAGYGGLSTAALLAKAGKEVLLLESHVAVGGCASSYKRKEFMFDVGATTFSGVRSHQPLGRLFKELQINPRLEKVNPGMIININGDEVIRHAELNDWIEESENKFGGDQKSFWREIHRIEELGWDFVDKNRSIPPVNFMDYLRIANPSNLKFSKLAPTIFKNFDSLVTKHGLQTNSKFKNFLDEQLLITTQNVSSDAPLFTAAMGLAYPAETYYPYGGMINPAKLILESFRKNGGEIKFKHRVSSIVQKSDYYEIATQNGKSFKTKHLISNLPIWNMVSLTGGNIQKYFQKQSGYFDFAWGAFAINFAIKTDEEIKSPYYQIHLKERIPYLNSGSIFVSFSLPDDIERAPEGWRTVTISSHTDVRNWENISEVERSQRKELICSKILNEFDSIFPDSTNAEKMYVLPGSPDTFEFYTKRDRGFVGGIPHSIKKSLLRMPPNKTPFENFYMVGDTAFPGQGTPAVVLGALNTIERILD